MVRGRPRLLGRDGRAGRLLLPALRRHPRPQAAAGPRASSVADPKELGSFIARDWVERDQVEPLFGCSFAAMPMWSPWAGCTRAVTTSTAVYDLAAEHELEGGVPARIALDHPFPGLIVTWTDAVDEEHLGELAERYRTEGLPVGGPMDRRLGPAGVPGHAVDRPRRARDRHPARAHRLHHRRPPRVLGLRDRRPGRPPLRSRAWTLLPAGRAVIPVVPGTTTYLDQLW